MMKIGLLKRERASEMILTMMIWAVFTILTTRLYLRLAGNPQIAFGVWHIAHVLWGGLLMLVALVIILVFYGRETREMGAILGGIGWGFFLDEVGKYLTRDNNYWFRPAIIFIYISFVILFLVYRRLELTKLKNKEALLYSVLEDLGEVANDDLEKTEKKNLIRKLKLIIKGKDQGEIKRIASGLLKMAKDLKVKEDRKESGVIYWAAKLTHTGYSKLFRKKLVTGFLAVYSGIYAIDKVADTLGLLFAKNRFQTLVANYSNYDFFSKGDVYMFTLKIISELLVSGLFLYGLVLLIRKQRIRGLRYYRHGLLVSIFLVSVFRFYFEQFSAVFGLVLDIIVFNWLLMYQNELTLKKTRTKLPAIE